MTSSRLLTLCLIVVSVGSQAQSVYNRVIAGFTAMAYGKTEWIDLDNDNDLDLLMTGTDNPYNPANTRTLVYENVAGALSLRTSNLPALSAFASADYDNDGDMDLLGFNWIAASPFTKIYRNDGGFVFTQTVSIGAFSPSSAVWLDIDNDEDLDFLLTGNIATPRLFENTGTGFTEVTNTGFPVSANYNADAADINGDGKVDIVFAWAEPALYLNAGNKQFIRNTDAQFKPAGGGDAAPGDFDGDDDLDILLTGQLPGGSSGYSAIYENRNNHLVERTDLGLTQVITDSSSGLLWFNINNDGKIDLFLSGRTDWAKLFSGKTRVFRNNGGGSFTDINDSYLAYDGFTGSFDAGDFDNDGDMDLGFQGTYPSLEGFPIPYPRTKVIAGYYRHEQINQTAVPNTRPLPPDAATFSASSFRKEIRLKWGDGSDAQTPSGGLFYNFYLRDAARKLVMPHVNFTNGNILTTNAPNGTGRGGYAFDMPEGTLYYAVQSIDGAKTGSVFSAEKSFYHFNGPEAVSVKFTDQQHADVSWLDHSALETNFEVLRSTSPATGFTTLATLPANTKTYADNFAFETETEYYYRIRGYNTQTSCYDSLVMVIPNRPGDIGAKAINASRIRVVWVDRSQYEISYVVERRQGTGNFTIIATLNPDVEGYEDTGLMDGTRYEYRITAKGKNGALAPNVTVTATTNALPAGVDFEIARDEDKTLTFTAADFNSHFTDADAADHLVKFKIVSLPGNGKLYVYTSEAAIGQEVTPDLFNFIEFKPYPDYAGTTSFKVRPYDGSDYGAKDWTITLTTNQVNDPPLFDLPATKVVDEDFVYTPSIIPQPKYFQGEENQVVTYSLSPLTSDLVTIYFSEKTGEIAITSLKNKFGQVEFTLTADDGQSQNNTYSRKIKVTIQPVDDPPVFGPIANVQTDSSTPVIIDLDIADPDSNPATSMFSAYSGNFNVVKPENIKFTATPDGKIRMSIVSERKEGSANISVELIDGNAYLTRQFLFSRVVITALEPEPVIDIDVIPNPVSKDFQIRRGNSREILTFHLADIQGRRLLSGTIDQPAVTIDLAGFAPGLYYLEILGNRKTITKKIVKL